MLRLLQPSLQVVQFVGSCEDAYLTEYHHLGDGAQLEHLFDQHMIISLLNNISTRFRMCKCAQSLNPLLLNINAPFDLYLYVNFGPRFPFIFHIRSHTFSHVSVMNAFSTPTGLDFVRAIAYVHTHSRVMCDSNDLLKMLSQFLITDDLRLILNDVDALPQVDHANGDKILCGHRQIGTSSRLGRRGGAERAGEGVGSDGGGVEKDEEYAMNFDEADDRIDIGEEERGNYNDDVDDYVAPEQRWPFDDMDFDEALQPKYDEKIDVWKIPATCEYLMGDVEGADHANFHLFDVNKECKQEDPSLRPSVGEVLSIYHAVCEHLEIACY